MSIRVVLADDHPLVRSGIRGELARQDDIQIAAEAVNGDEALALALEHSPDILILDVNMPGKPAYQVIRQVKARLDKTRVLVVSAYGDTGTVAAMLQAGTDGYVLKEEDPERIVDAVYALAKGESWFSTALAPAIEASRRADQDCFPQMTGRECEILKLLEEGLTNKEMALRLEISERTVEYHLDRIMDKVGVRTRTGVALWMQSHRFLLS
jgi:DNA-binding NarL/FixJ family response regulator